MVLKECRRLALIVWTATAVACSGPVPPEAAEPPPHRERGAGPATGGGESSVGSSQREPVPLDCVMLSDLLVPPRRLRYRQAELPQEMATVRTHGGVLVYDVTIGPSGDVTSVRLAKPVDPMEPWPTLAETWRSAILDWSYEPTTVEGKPVPVCLTATVTIDVK
jgi:hypothetical protein